LPARPPSALRGWRSTALALGVAVALSATSSFETAVATSTAPPKEQALLRTLNETRSSLGLRGLGLSERLTRMARRHSRRMARVGRLFHHSCLACRFPNGSFTALGENVGVGGSVRSVHQMMMQSTTHRNVILGAVFERVGIGVVKKGRRLWVTEIFFG
jgi:uncharacterized protein YkwD